MDPRRIELNRRHSREMGKLHKRFLDAHPDPEFGEIPMTDAEDAAWGAYSAELLARHQAEREALATQLEAEHEQRQRATAAAGRMDETEAISRVVLWIRAHGLDYPTEGLKAERFSVGWSVYAPVEIDESDPLAFLDIPVGRAIFLIGDSGRIEESSSSVPPSVARDGFTRQELALRDDG
ncbi:hypothetical protein [Nocardia sp. NPDC051750]|uniref:hypothetical protein n=1 Tax=Nocardia sp. NPDC051750 TaxID=3364325 RepID=UPI0037B4787E